MGWLHLDSILDTVEHVEPDEPVMALVVKFINALFIASANFKITTNHQLIRLALRSIKGFYISPRKYQILQKNKLC